MFPSPRVLSCRSIRRHGKKKRAPSSYDRKLCFCTCTSASPSEDDFDRLQKSFAQTGVSSYASLLRSCGDGKMWKDGMYAHHHIILHSLAHDAFLQGLLVQMYGKCGSLEHALKVFHAMPEHSAYSWNFIIRASAQQEHYEESLKLFRQMQQEGAAPDKFTYVCAFTACTGKGDLSCSMQMHARIVDSSIEFDTAVGTSVVNMYGNCGRVRDAKLNFERMSEHDVVSWNVMLAIYAQHDQIQQASQLFYHMQQQGCLPTHVSFLSMLDACAIRSELGEEKRGHVCILTQIQGKRIHSCINSSELESDFTVGSALVTMYGNHGNLDEARKVFDRFINKNVVLWTAMISVYAQGWRGDEGLKLFVHMQQCGVLPNEVTYVSVLDACITQGALCGGKNLHAYISSGGFLSDVPVLTSLIDMYSKCGKLDDAWVIFHQAPVQDNLLWNTVISMYSQHGHASKVMELFESMEKEGVKPDKVTFISILTACSHSGLIEDGFYWLSAVLQDYDLLSNSDHYVCMIDTVGRAGQLELAQSLVSGMPFQPTEVPYITLLRACQQGAYLTHGGWAATHSFELDSGNTAPYVLLSNIHAAESKS